MGESLRYSYYNGLQHFISKALWHYGFVMDQVSQEVNTLLQTEKTPAGFTTIKAAIKKNSINQLVKPGSKVVQRNKQTAVR